MEIHCIYKIQSKINGKIYIGSAKNFNRRKQVHFWLLNNNKHPNIHLQRHVNKYGINSIEMVIIEPILFKEDLIKKEQYWIDKLEPKFNICKRAGSTLGVKCSDSKKEYLRKLFTGRKATPEAIESNRLGQLKRSPPTLETRKKLSISNTGKKQSFESIEKIKKTMPHKKEIKCIETGVTYISIRHAANELNINRHCISRNLRGIFEKAGKFTFNYV